MKIVITGALGHIGSALIRHLFSQFLGAELILIDNLYTQRYCSLFNLAIPYKFIEADARNCKLPEHDVVVHLAAYTEPHNPNLDWQHNLDATANIAKQAKRLIFPSTISVLPHPQTPYAASKLKEEGIAEGHTIIRLGNLFGPSPGMRFHTVVSKFCWQAITGQKLTVWKSALQQKRPYVDLVDMCRAIGFLIKHDSPGLYNVATETATLQDVVDNIQKHVGVELDIVDSPHMNEVSQEVDTDGLERLGFVFVGSLKNGIKSTLTMLQSQG